MSKIVKSNNQLTKEQLDRMAREWVKQYKMKYGVRTKTTQIDWINE